MLESASRVGGTAPAHATHSPSGAIPFRLRVGVTGHRALLDEEALRERVRAALQRARELIPASSATPVHIGVVSPLAEGADRLVAGEAINDERATLEVPLPFPVDEYLKDFTSEESKREFERLLDEAGVITVLPPTDVRNEAYEQVGLYVVDRCDVLIAIWDGRAAHGFGGTADIVEHARETGVPIIWIHSVAPYEVTEELGKGVSLTAFGRLDAYNRSGIDERRFARDVAGEVARYASAAEKAGLDRAIVHPFLDWIWSYFARADALAVRYQTLYVRFAVSLFLLGAAAVTVVAAQTLFFPSFPQLAWLEVGVMLSLLVILYVSHRLRLHDHWISHRYLAEQFRTAFFLGLSGVGDSRQLSPERIAAGHGAEEWMDRAYDEVWSQRPDAHAAESHFEQLRRFLATSWVLDQRNYHEKVSERNERKHRRFTNASVALFAVTLLAAVIHALGIGHESHDTHAIDEHATAGQVASLPSVDGLAPAAARLLAAEAPTASAEQSPLSLTNLLTFLAIVLPAVGGAMGGIHAQREYHRNAERFARMVPVLDASHRRLERATDPATLQGVVEDVQNLLLDEVRDWFVVMRFHDIELHV